MGSQWTNKYNIMRDLSMVQGRVPADINNTLTSGDKPPAVNVTEETEEEFFRSCTGEGDIAAPDLGLIRQMLDIVREIDEPSDTEDVENLKNAIQISKLNPMTPDFVPQNLNHTSTKPEMAPEQVSHKKKSTKQNRNVALSSILELASPIIEKENEQKRLTNSVDVSPNVTASVKKVNGWFEACGAENILSSDPGSKKKTSSVKESDTIFHSLKHTKLVQPPPPKDVKDILRLDPSTMFRKKVSPKVVTVVESNKEKVKSAQGCEEYVPSSNADEYYKKYLERSKVHAMVHDDVWTRAERQMKEIDERRRKEAELFQQSYIAAHQSLQSLQSVQSSTSEASRISTQKYTIATEPATILNESSAMLRQSPDVLSASSTILSESPAISPALSATKPVQAPPATKPVQAPWNLTTSEEQRLAVVRLPYHRHILTADCTVCRVRQESQDDKVIYVIDADDRRLLKQKDTDFDEIGGPTWRNDENLKEWCYDDETNSWHKKDEVPKSQVNKEPKPEPKSEPKPRAKKELKSEPKPELKSDLKPRVKKELKSEPKLEPKSEPKPRVKKELKPEPNPEPKSEPKPRVKKELKLETKPEPKSEPKPRVKKEPKSSRKNKGELQVYLENSGNVKKPEKSDLGNISNTGRKNNEIQLYRPENDVTYIEAMMGNNELDYYNVDSPETVFQ